MLWGLLYIIVVVGIASLLLWALRRLGPAELYEPARLVIGLVVLVAIVLILIRVLTAGLPL